MTEAEHLPTLTKDEWQHIRQQRDQWFRGVQLVPSAMLVTVALALLVAAFWWKLWFLAGLSLFVAGVLTERSGEHRGYDYGYEQGFYAGFQRRADHKFTVKRTPSDEGE
jgi:hypothetical protein